MGQKRILMNPTPGDCAPTPHSLGPRLSVVRGLLPLLAACLTGHPASAAEADYKSEPVSWAFVRAEGASLSLDGVFQISLKGDGHWRRRPMVAGPTGVPLNSWDIQSADDSRMGMFAIMDIALDKVPEGQRDTLMRSLAAAFQRSWASIMSKAGFGMSNPRVTALEGNWPHAMKAVSWFHRGDETQVSTTYLYPAGRLYILSYLGPSEDEPAWFTDTRQSMDIK